jgi:outer membrane protein assembly factor BamB
VRTAVAVRGRTCGTCGHPVGARDARWCGSCGAPQTTPDARDHDLPGRHGGPPLGPAGARLGRRRLDRGTVATAVAVLAVLAVVLGLIATSGGLVDRLADGWSRAGTGVEDGTVGWLDADALGEVERRPPTPLAGRTTPACVEGGLACFAWVAEAEERSGFDEVMIADGTVLSREARSERIVARDLRDGTVRWTADTGQRFVPVHEGFHVAGGLLVTSEGEEVVGRDLATGRERFRTDGLGRLTIFAVERSGDTLVLAGEDRHTIVGPAAAVAAGVDVTTGAVRFREGALAVSLGADGTSLATTEGGHVRALGPDGAERWQLEDALDPDRGASVWATGHVVAIHDDAGGVALSRTSDGAPLGLTGWAVVSDETHTVVELHPGAEGRPARTAYALVDRDGEVWRTTEGLPDCVSDVRFRGRTVELTGCNGEVVQLDRTTGTVASRRPPDGMSHELGILAQLGHYSLIRGHAAGGGEEQTVVDHRDGRIVARLPADTWPVWRWPAGPAPEEDEVVVLQHRRFLMALPGGPAPAHGGPAR